MNAAESQLNPWTSIWLSPRVTVRWLIEHRPGYLMHLLITAKMFADGIGAMMFHDTGDRLSLQAILVILGVMTPIQMIFYLYVFVWLVKWTGRMLGGRASVMELRTALAWAVPFSRYYDAGMVLPSAVTLSHDYINNCLPRARAYGLAVQSFDDDAVMNRDLAASPDRVMLADDGISRWLNELVYEQFCATVEMSADSAPTA